MQKITVGVVGLASYIPPKQLTNADLEKMVDTSDEWITTRTGIKVRHIVENETPSVLGTQAARLALANAGVTPEEVDLIVTATATPDMIFPSTACLIQHNIGAVNAGAFDVGAGCSGFIYALTVGQQFILGGTYKTVLVIGAETLTRLTNWQDRNTCVLFGDGAGAAVLRPIEEGRGIISSYLGADGGGAELLKLEAGASKTPASHETVEQGLHYIYMNGNEVFKFAINIMGEAALKVLQKAGLSPEEIKYFIPHQANIRIIQSAARRLGLSMDKVYVNVDRYGNTSSASVPIALDEAIKLGKVKKGDLVLLVAFGAGLTWASMVLEV
jgi:3-oxoacyl-[acyl-carrier-protein] synthase-3